MTPEQLVEQLNKAIPGKLVSAVLYGSAAAGDFMPQTSDYNVLLVVDGLGVAELDALSKPVAQWSKAGHRPPLLFTRGQLRASASVFPIELLDMRQSHRRLFGEDVLAEMTISHEHLRLQLERELTEKLLTLREGYLLTKGQSKQVVRLARLVGYGGPGAVSGSAAAVPGRGACGEGRVAAAIGAAYSLRSAAALGRA